MADKWVKRWTVPSESDPDKAYTVAQDADGNWGCSCPTWKFRRQECKHIDKVKRLDPEPDTVVDNEEPTIRFWHVREVTPIEVCGRVNWIKTPLIPLSHTHFQVTVVYDLLQVGVSWKTLQGQYGIAKKNTKRDIIAYVESRGRCIYGPVLRDGSFDGYKIVTRKPRREKL